MPIAGTNITSLTILGSTAPTGSEGTINGYTQDPLNEFGYALINWSQSTTISTASLPATTLTVGNGAIFLSAGWVAIPTASNGVQLVQYAAVSGNTLTGCTGGTGTPSGTIYQAPSIAQIQLSNMTLTSGLQWGIFPIGSTGGLFGLCYDAVGDQLITIGTGSVLWGMPITGTGGTAGTAATLNGGSSITNITFVACQFLNDVTTGNVFQVAQNQNNVSSFILNDPTGVNANFASGLHPISVLKGGTNNFLGLAGLAIGRGMANAPANQVALACPNNIPGVYVWSENEYGVVCVLDDQGAAQSSGQGSGFSSASYSGPAVGANMQGLAFDSNGNLYMLPKTLTNIAYVTKWNLASLPPTATALNSGSAMTHSSTTLVGCPFVVNSTNGYTGSGSAYPQMFYCDGKQLNVCK
jgi:hypothetical protein